MSLTMLAPLAMVAAMTKSRVIGAGNSIPWHIPEDMKHFRRMTLGHAIIMGRATYESMGKPLSKRRNIVLSRDPQLQLTGCEVASSLDAALRLAREHDDEPRIIGGEHVYRAALPHATRLLLTYLDIDVPGDTYFPEIDATQWQEAERQAGPGLHWVTLVRR